MERNRHQHRVTLPEVAARGCHQPCAEPRQLRTVAVLEAAHELAGDLVVDHRRPGPPKWRGIGDGLGRARIGSEINLKWQTEHRAARCRDWPQRAEAIAAERVRRRNRHIAVKAERRVKLVEQEAARGAQPRQPRRCFDNPGRALHKPEPTTNGVLREVAAPIVFDRELIARRLARRTGDDFATDLVVGDLAERLSAVTRRFEQALIMAPVADRLPTEGTSANGRFAFERVATLVGSDGIPLVDPEDLYLPRTRYDLIVSLLDLQVVNDVPGFIARARAHLRADGLFLAATLGGDTLTELRQAFLEADATVLGGAAARVAPFVPPSEAGGLIQRAGLALPVADVETHIVRYASPLALMREVKSLGASNPLADRPERMATKMLIAAASSAYERLFADRDGRIRATLEILWLSGWAPHESQQQPLKPGSAEVSLTKVLKTKG